MNVLSVQKCIGAVNKAGDYLAAQTRGLVDSWFGKLFLTVVLIGPLTFIPTVIAAWTADDISALRTATWPLMMLVNLSALVSVAHQGDWRMRLVTTVWMIVIPLVWLATVIR